MPLLPNDFCLGMTTLGEGNYFTIQTPLNKPANAGGWLAGGKRLLQIQAGGFLFSCCGASAMQGLSASFESEREKQSFVCKLFRSLEPGQTYYMIADSGQLKRTEKFPTSYPYGVTIDVLKELGATEVDARPNKNHGPNRMHLHIWAPELRSNEAWRKYLRFYQDSPCVPLWWDALSDAEKQKLLDDSKAQVEAQAEAAKALRERKKQQQESDHRCYAQFLLRQGKLDDILADHGWRKGHETVRDLGPQKATVSDWAPLSFTNRS